MSACITHPFILPDLWHPLQDQPLPLLLKSYCVIRNQFIIMHENNNLSFIPFLLFNLNYYYYYFNACMTLKIYILLVRIYNYINPHYLNSFSYTVYYIILYYIINTHLFVLYTFYFLILISVHCTLYRVPSIVAIG